MTTKSKHTAAVWAAWLAVLLCMGLIFYFSSRPGDESAAQSNAILDFLRNSLHLPMDSFFVRKLAHTTEFAGLGFLLGNAFFQTFQTQKPLFSLLCGSAYAATDELHQLFVSGRSCQITDWMIDTFGVCIGVFIFALLVCVIRRISSRGRAPS